MFLPPRADAGILEKLVMPGPVIIGHAKYEENCSLCHKFFKKENQNRLCLDCHKDVRKDINAKKGFHSSPEVKPDRECKDCHTEHEGRNADIIQLDQATFDHALTDFLLKKSHKQIKCNRCHLPDIKYRNAPSDCFSCHKSDDPHSLKLGKGCSDCHNETVWEKTKFDHGKTDFALKWKHKKISCSKCHPNQQYKKTPKQCISCHAFNDIHDRQYGEKCDVCHNAKGWKRSLIGHNNKKIKFPLEYSHANLPCKKCHTDALKYSRGVFIFDKKLKKECAGCHLNDDSHKGRFESKCETCHIPSQWKKVKFLHDKDTKFKLIGNHVTLACEICHKGNIYKEKLDIECISCHKRDDVHKGQEGKKCGDCHNQLAWQKEVKFDHEPTKFPLVGIHAITTCEGCHLAATFKDVSSKCIDCHKEDDKHKDFGEKCEVCHHPDSWKFWKFDHTKQTDFSLIGAHDGLECKICHTGDIQADKLGIDCYACHKTDDVHKGKQGDRCSKCHTQQTWAAEIKFDHDITNFPLIGIHAITACEECHISSTFKDIQYSCVECHNKDDSHKQRLGQKCESCHNPNSWDLWQFDHNVQTDFILEGSHEGLECKACHLKKVKEKIKLPNDCSDCHERDDIHNGRFGMYCGRCHETGSFEKIIIKH